MNKKGSLEPPNLSSTQKQNIILLDLRFFIKLTSREHLVQSPSAWRN